MPKWNVDGQFIEADRSEINNGHLMFWSRPVLTQNEEAVARITGWMPNENLLHVFAPGAWKFVSLEK